MTAIAACQTCGTTPLENARFCHGCGSPVQDGDTRAEYKQVTVLFADVVHSMHIAAAVGAERLREIMAELADRCSGVVKRFGGTVGSFTGDGIMAVFGAPVALEDHAVRACLAGLGVQEQAQRLAVEVREHDGVDLQLRVGLNSGEVIAGEIGSGSFGYTAVGEQVGMAQRIESIAPPGGVMLSESTASLVEYHFALSTKEFVHIKGSEGAVPARRLLSVSAERRVDRRHSRLVGRESETVAISAILDNALDGVGAVVTVSGPPGIGKTRLVREAVSAATSRGFEVFSTYCESHTREISFHVISRLLRAVFGIGGLTPEAARIQVRAGAPHTDAEDLLLLDELLGIRDTDIPLPDISPDARRRRLIELIKTVSVARPNPAVYVIEDAHWLDSVSESMLTDFAAAIPLQMRAMMLITYRPEYRGTLSELAEAEAIVLAPLSDSSISELLEELLGADSSVGSLSTVVADRAAGIPFCAEEIVRDLAERGEIEGDPGAYVCRREVGDVHVPPTLQAAIGDRIDRLTPSAKRTLNAAAVIGARFRAGLLERLLDRTDLTPLVEAELVDQVTYGDDAEYAFHHPLTQKVAYESQLKAARSDLHRRVAEMMEQTNIAATGEGAAMIAAQYESAGELSQAYEWFMRAATGYGPRDIRAARGSWEQAARVADQISADHPNCLAMRISPRAFLCGSAFRVGGVPETTGFEELRDYTAAAGDKKSLAVGMAGYLNTLTFNSRHREAVHMASEFAALVESIGEPEMVVGLLYGAAQANWEAGEVVESQRLAQRIIDLADGDPVMGNFVIGSPLAWAMSLRGTSAMALGRPGWRADIERGIAMARSYDATTRILAEMYKFVPAMGNAIVPDAEDISLTSESLQIALQSGDNSAVAFAYLNRAAALLHSPEGDRAAGIEALTAAREMIVREKLSLTLRRLTDIEFARAKLRSGELDDAIALTCQVVDEQFTTDEMIFRGPATAVLGEALLRRGTPSDIDEAQKAVDRLAAVPTDPGFVLHELPLLRLRALLAWNSGDKLGYQQFLARFREKALAAHFEGYLAQADAMA